MRLLPLLAGLAFAVMGGCSHEDPPVIIDADEILRYMDEVGIARELFRTDNLFSSQPYTLPNSSATFTDRVLKNERSRDVYLVPLKIHDTAAGANKDDSIYNDPAQVYMEYGSLGELREALVEVDDKFTVEVKRAFSADTMYDTTTTTLTRYAFFLKAGSDNRDYVGWVLYGFRGSESGQNQSVFEVKSSGGSDFYNTQIYNLQPLSASRWIPTVSYVRLTFMDTIQAGERIRLSASNASSYHVISDFDSTGFFARAMIRYDEANHADSLSYVLPSSLPRLYNFIIVHQISIASFLSREIFAIPYRGE
jgi:hypothetical protein